MVKILNIGSGGTHVPIDGVEETRLDANPHEKPDYVCDICDLKKLKADVYDCVWATHVLEHVFECNIPRVIEGVKHVLKKDGVFFAVVPDLKVVMKEVVEKNLNLDDLLYTAHTGLKVRVLDIFYGHWQEVEKLKCLQSHKTGFDLDLLMRTLLTSGFQTIYTSESNYEVRALACLGEASEWVKETFRIKGEGAT